MRIVRLLAVLAAWPTYAAGSPVDRPDDPAVKVCEASLKDSLLSPASYKRIESAVIGSVVTLKYDASNAFGASLRHNFQCRFTFHQGEFYLETEQVKTVDPRSLPIQNEDTALSPSGDDVLVNDCIDEIIRQHDVAGPLPAGAFKTRFFRPAMGIAERVLMDRKVRLPGWPRNVDCQRKDDGTVVLR